MMVGLEIDNNAAERALRAVALGRKNYLFQGSDAGGEYAAAMYSLIGSAKLNDIDPEAYLSYVLSHIADHPVPSARRTSSLEHSRSQNQSSDRIRLVRHQSCPRCCRRGHDWLDCVNNGLAWTGLDAYDWTVGAYPPVSGTVIASGRCPYGSLKEKPRPPRRW
jgi:hypothetical protein